MWLCVEVGGRLRGAGGHDGCNGENQGKWCSGLAEMKGACCNVGATHARVCTHRELSQVRTQWQCSTHAS